MGYIKVRGIVIRETVVGDSDKIVTVFTKEMGKLSLSARGAKKAGSRIAAGTQLLSYADFVLYETKQRYSINSCEVLSSFYNVRNDLAQLTYAAHMIEIIQDVIQENHPSPDILRLFLLALQQLTEKDKDLDFIKSVFELRAVSELGFAPHIMNCVVCKTRNMEEIFFDYSNCGFICEKCAVGNGNSVKIGSGVAKAIVYVVCAEIKELFKFDLSKEVLKQFNKIVEKYIGERLEKKYTKLQFLKNVHIGG